MPYKIKLNDDGSTIIVTYYELLNSYEMYAACSELFSGAEQIMNYEVIISDFTDVSQTHLRDLDIKRLAQVCDKAAAHKQDIIAVFIMPTAFLFSLGRIWQEHALTLPWKVRVVRTRKEATDWIESLLKFS